MKGRRAWLCLEKSERVPEGENFRLSIKGEQKSWKFLRPQERPESTWHLEKCIREHAGGAVEEGEGSLVAG